MTERKKILVVEDETSLQLLIGVTLTDAGYEVLGPAATVASAVDFISSGRPDAALLNVTLRFATSFPVAELLASRGIPFAFITGLEPDELPPNLRHHPILRKPFGSNDLLAEINALLREDLHQA